MYTDLYRYLHVSMCISIVNVPLLVSAQQVQRTPLRQLNTGYKKDADHAGAGEGVKFSRLMADPHISMFAVLQLARTDLPLEKHQQFCCSDPRWSIKLSLDQRIGSAETAAFGGTWNRRPSGVSTMWRLLNIADTERPWTVTGLAFYADEARWCWWRIL